MQLGHHSEQLCGVVRRRVAAELLVQRRDVDDDAFRVAPRIVVRERDVDGRVIRIHARVVALTRLIARPIAELDSAIRQLGSADFTRPIRVSGPEDLQSLDITTINADSHLFVRLARLTNQRDFLDRYGDNGEDEFSGRGGTIPQALLRMNGQLTRERIKEDLFTASSRIAGQAPDDARAVEAAYLTILTRRPTPAEAAHFTKFLADRTTLQSRGQKMEDVFWVLINSTEFSWNH